MVSPDIEIHAFDIEGQDCLLMTRIGYSLVEVMVAIAVSIAIAIVGGMFATWSLKSATQAINYDRGRAGERSATGRTRALTYTRVVAAYPPPSPSCQISLATRGLHHLPDGRHYYVRSAIFGVHPGSGNTMEIVVTIRSTAPGQYTTTGAEIRERANESACSKGRRGSTLPELLVTMLIMIMTLFALYSVFGRACGSLVSVTLG